MALKEELFYYSIVRYGGPAHEINQLHTKHSFRSHIPQIPHTRRPTHPSSFM